MKSTFILTYYSTILISGMLFLNLFQNAGFCGSWRYATLYLLIGVIVFRKFNPVRPAAGSQPAMVSDGRSFYGLLRRPIINVRFLLEILIGKRTPTLLRKRSFQACLIRSSWRRYTKTSVFKPSYDCSRKHLWELIKYFDLFHPSRWTAILAYTGCTQAKQIIQ